MTCRLYTRPLHIVLLLMVLEIAAGQTTRAVPVDLGATPPPLTGPLEQNDHLTKTERYKINQVKGAESFVHHNGQVYTGLADGRIVDISECGVKTITTIGGQNCSAGQCGRPRGMRLDNYGRLLVADAVKGIVLVDPTSGKQQLLFSSSTPVKGRPCKHINDVIISKDNTVIFTDSSAKWGHEDSIYSFLEGETTGRILAFSPKANKAIAILDDLAFPNGLAFTPDQSAVLFTETNRARIKKLHLTPGQNWLKMETFANNLPGFPTNIRASGRGTYWVSMAQVRHANKSSALDETKYGKRAALRDMMAMMSPKSQLHTMLENYGMVVEMDQSGSIVRSLQDPTGERVNSVTEASEQDGLLYLGSKDGSFVSRVSLSNTLNVDRFLTKLKSTCRGRNANFVNLRRLLRRIIAIAEFRKALIEAKRRRDEAASATTAAPTTTVQATDSTTSISSTSSDTSQSTMATSTSLPTSTEAASSTPGETTTQGLHSTSAATASVTATTAESISASTSAASAGTTTAFNDDDVVVTASATTQAPTDASTTTSGATDTGATSVASTEAATTAASASTAASVSDSTTTVAASDSTTTTP